MFAVDSRADAEIFRIVFENVKVVTSVVLTFDFYTAAQKYGSIVGVVLQENVVVSREHIRVARFPYGEQRNVGRKREVCTDYVGIRRALLCCPTEHQVTFVQIFGLGNEICAISIVFCARQYGRTAIGIAFIH